jgi:primosomal protein N'
MAPAEASQPGQVLVARQVVVRQADQAAIVVGNQVTDQDVRDKLDEARDRIKAEAPVRDSAQRLSEWLTRWYDTALEASSRNSQPRLRGRGVARKRHAYQGGRGPARALVDQRDRGHLRTHQQRHREVSD